MPFSDPHAFASNIMEQAASQLAVFVRPAKLSDSEHLIHLNQAFRYEMAQWEAGIDAGEGEDEGYPVLDYDDVEYILTQEDPVNLIVLGRRLENEERIIGYSYSYTEPWESAVSKPARRTRTGATPRKQPRGRTRGDHNEPQQESLYLAELFISEQERGLGLGELLLTGTLHARNYDRLSSHLFVSSKNISAVKCYLKFGYDRGSRPSGDAAHDLVMEMRNCAEGVMRSVERLSQQLMMGTIGARRRRKPAILEKKEQERQAREAGSSPTYGTESSRSASASSSASTVDAESRTSSRSSLRSSPPPHAMKPRATRATLLTHSEEPASTRRSLRSDRESLELISAPIQARQRKPLRPLGHARTDTRHEKSDAAKRPCKASGLRINTQNFTELSPKKLATRRMKRPKFMLTGMRTSAVANAKAVLGRLSAEVLDSDKYDANATHVIAPRALRTEKFLCALAAGKHLLKAGYVQDCDSAGRLLPETGYEWEVSLSNANGCRQHLFNHGSALSARRPRACNSVNSPTKSKGASAPGDASGCFSGIVPALLITPEKRECFRRVLEAGSAVLSKGQDKACKAGELAGAGITHGFVSRELLEDECQGWSEPERRAALKQLAELQDAGVPCLFDNVIVDFLMCMRPKSEDYAVPLVAGGRANRTGKGEKRKGCASAGGIEQYCKKTRMTLLQPSH